MIEKVLSRSVRVMFTGGLVATAGIMALPATAQEKKVESVIITGTRITTPNAHTAEGKTKAHLKLTDFK